jgi:hypothetical protein
MIVGNKNLSFRFIASSRPIQKVVLEPSLTAHASSNRIFTGDSRRNPVISLNNPAISAAHRPIPGRPSSMQPFNDNVAH